MQLLFLNYFENQNLSGKGIAKKTCILLVSVILLNGSVFAQSSVLTEKLQDYNRAMISELIYIQTDRDVYYKGDTIWFNAYIRNKADLTESSLSQVFNVSLVSDDGVNLLNGRYIIFDSQVHGQFLLDRNVDEGYYYLTAFSSWMKNFGFEDIYKKRIYISGDNRKNIKITPYFSEAGYYPGEEIRLKLASNDDYYEVPEKLEYTYKVKVDGDVIRKGDSEDQEISFLYDSSFHSPPYIDVNGRKSTADLDTVIVVPVNRDLDITFFPEGGHCINGLTGQIAFKALYSDGRPANISGKIVDELGKELTIAYTEHEGMGAFMHTPEKGRSCYFISDSKMDYKRFNLPSGEDLGWQVKVNSISEGLLEVVISNPSLVRESGFLLLQVRNSVIFCKAFEIEEQIIITVPTDSIPVGVGVFSILDADLKIQAERLTFINYSKQNLIEIYTDSTSYRPRDSTVVHLTLKDKDKLPINGHFSFTAYNEIIGSRGYFDEPDILTTYYLQPEIKGHILNPDYYFHPESQNIERKLDLLLMTQGWRNYKYIIENTDSLVIPHSQEQIQGNITKYTPGRGMVPVKGSVRLIYCGDETEIKTDNSGSFFFNPIFEKDYNPDLFLSVIDKNDKRIFELNVEMNEYLISYINYLAKNISDFNNGYPSPIYTYEYLDQNTFKSSFRDQFLGEVKFQARRKAKMEDDYRNRVRNHPSVQKIPQGILDTSKDIKEILKKRGIHILVREWGTINDKAYMPADQAPYQYAVIGYTINNLTCQTCTYTEIDHIKPDMIDEMFIGKGWDMSTIGGGYLSIFIFTKRPHGCPINLRYFKSDAFIGFDVVKEFYSPKYPSESEQEREASDFRRTIHWQQKAIVDSSGQSRISFFNADQKARIKCVVEGFGENNLPFHQEYYYEVHDNIN